MRKNVPLHHRTQQGLAFERCNCDDVWRFGDPRDVGPDFRRGKCFACFFFDQHLAVCMNQATGSVHFMMCIMHVYKIYCNQRKGALAHIPDMNFEEDESSSFANGCIECCFLGEARFLCASDSDAVGMVHRGFVGLQHHNKVDAHTNAKHLMIQYFQIAFGFYKLST